MTNQPIMQQQTVDYFPSQAIPSEVISGIGEFFLATSPVVHAAKKIRENTRYSVNGLGQVERVEMVAGGTMLAVVAAALLLRGVFSYQVGKAMAPTKSKEKAWGWWGVPVGMFTGLLGLGIMGMVSNARK